MRPRFDRQRLIERLRSRIEGRGYPRLQMVLIVGLTGGAGFLATFSLLRRGVESMALRYPLAIGAAYLAFLFLLWLWLRTSASDYTDLPDLSWGSSPSQETAAAPTEGLDLVELPTSAKGGGGGASDVLGGAAEGDELVVALAVLAIAAAVLFSSFWIVYSAPVLFAELLVDGVLSASLYRRLRGLETRHWLATAIRRTIWPFLITAAVAGIAGLALQAQVPDAHTLGEVLRARGW